MKNGSGIFDLNSIHNYFDFCDVLHRMWFEKTIIYEKNFEKVFHTDYSPEPYFILKDGSNPLFILSTNPGLGIDFQKHENFEKSDYKNFSKVLGNIYTSKQFKKDGGSNTYRRLMKSIAWADHLGYDSIINIKAIPFHSPNLSKSKALNIICKSWVLSRYQEVLRNFLANKPVLIIADCSSKISFSIETIKNNKWIMSQADLANVDVENLKLKPLTKINEKMSSALLYGNKKYILPTTSFNNLPSE